MSKLPSQEKYSELTLEDFAQAFGTTAGDIPADCRELIGKTDFGYRKLKDDERDKVILEVLKKIESDTQIIGAEERQGVWERGWAENLDGFVKSKYDLTHLVPRFIRPNQPVRLGGDYVMPRNPNFELDYFSVYRLWLFRKYLSQVGSIYEFGCGTGFNLVVLARLYPEKDLHGLDFVASSRDLVNKIAEIYGWRIKGHLFDMISPDGSLKLAPDSAIFTFGVIEQLAGKFEPFLQYILRNSPALCLNVEPTIELYDETRLVDFLAARFHRKRGYTQGYLTRLRELEAQNRIEILKVKRPFFGSLFMEGYSYVVWRPKKTL